MTNFVLGTVILGILGLSIGKIIIEKRKGVKCIGCPHGGGHAKKNCGCNH